MLILGGIGGRLDHTLANICTLLFLEQHGVCAWLRSEAGLCACFAGAIWVPAQKDVYVSLFPMNGDVHGLCLRGFRYPLEHAVLRAASTLGTSNEFAAQEGYVSFTSGSLIYMQCKRTGNPPPCRRARLFEKRSRGKWRRTANAPVMLPTLPGMLPPDFQKPEILRTANRV